MNKITNPISQLEHGLDMAILQNNPGQIGIALVNLGKEKIANGDTQAGITLIDQAINLAQTNGDTVSVIRYTGLKGTALSDAGQYEEAATSLDKALVLADESGELALKCDALANIGLLLVETGDVPHGLKRTQEALIVAIEIEDTQRTMKHRGTMGNLYLMLSDFEGAVQAFNEAYRLAGELGNKKAQVGFLNNIGLVYFEAAKFERVVEYFEQVLPLAVALNDAALEKNGVKFLMKAHHELGNSIDVLSYAQRANEIFVDKNDVDTKLVLNDMEIVALLRENRYREAIDAAQAAVDGAEQQQLKKLQLTFLGYLADAYYGNDAFDEAIDAYEQARKLAVRLQERGIEARLLGRMGAVSADMDRIEESNKYIVEAIALGERFEDWHTVGAQYYLLALNYVQMEEKQRAIECCQQSVETFKLVGATSYIESVNGLLESLQA